MDEVQRGEGAGLESSAPPAPDAGILLTPEQRRRMRLWLGLLGTLASCSLLGTAFSMYLVKHQPVLLILLSPLGRHLVLVAHSVDPGLFVALGSLRRFAFFLPCFELGREHGAAALDLLDRRMHGLRPYIGVIQRSFALAPHALVLALPGPIMSTLAGSSGMRRAAWAPLVLLGLCVRMWLWLEIADWARQPIDVVLELIDRYWLEGTVLLLVCIGLYQWRQRRRDAQNTLA